MSVQEQCLYTIQKLPEEDRPRERLSRHGAESLSSAELIAILIGSGIKGLPVMQLAHDIIAHFGSLERLADATLTELCQIKGLGSVKAIQLKAAFSLGIRAAKQTVGPKYRASNPTHIYHFIKDELERETRELFIAILLDVKNCIITKELISIGTISQTLVHPREVFYPAIRHKAASIVLCHNHPTGDPTPSEQDLQVTQELIQCGNMLKIKVYDHIIIGHNTFVSLRQKGVKFE